MKIKFFLSFIGVFIFGLLISGNVSAEAGASPSAITALIKYSREEIEITSSEPVYYAQIKNDTETAVKATELIAVAADASGKYIIDISTISASKVYYLAITNTNTATGGALTVPITKKVKVAGTQKKVNFNVNWAAEGSSAYGTGIFYSIEIAELTGNPTVYTQTATSSSQPISAIANRIQWRKGANCSWESITAMTPARWESIKNSGAVLYFRLAPVDEVSEGTGARIGKEFKVKVAITKAPSVKVDVSKLSLSVKNGMQIRNGGTTGWTTILPFSAKATSESAIMSRYSGVFDPYSNATATKVSGMVLDDVYSTLGITAASGAAVTIEYRTAATTKKPASRVGVITIPAQAEAPNGKATYSQNEFLISGLPTADSQITKPSYEYFIAKKSDVAGNRINLSAIKWSGVNNGSKLKTTLKCTYTPIGEKNSINVSLAEDDAVILIRRKGQNATAKANAVLASKYCVIDAGTIRKSSGGSPTVSATPTPTGTPTATPTPTPTATPTPTPTPAA